MGIVHYPALIEGGAKDGYGVVFPDFPGCVSTGDTMQEAALSAEEALRLHIHGMLADGDNLPDASELDSIAADPEIIEAGHLLVRAEVPGHAVRVNITLEEGLLAAIDATASTRNMSRSALLAQAAQAMIYRKSDET